MFPNSSSNSNWVIFFKTKLINTVYCIVCMHCLPSVNSISLISGPSDARIALGGDAVFNCSVVDVYPNTLYWLGPNENYITFGTIVYTSGTGSLYSVFTNTYRYDLRISGVQLADAGEYACGYYTHDDKSYYYQKATLTVLQPPSQSSPLCSLHQNGNYALPLNTPFYIGESVEFRCSSQGHGYTTPNLNNTVSNSDITENTILSVQGIEVVQSMITIENIDSKFKCYLNSEALLHSKSCSINLTVLSPEVLIKPSSMEALEMTNVSFQCSVSDFKSSSTPQYEWRIFPDVPGEVDTFTNSTLSITNIAINTTSLGSHLFLVSCFVRDTAMIWNASGSLSITRNKLISPKMIENNSNIDEINESEKSALAMVTGIVFVVLCIVVLTVVVFIFRKKILSNIFEGKNSNPGSTGNDTYYNTTPQNKDSNLINDKQVNLHTKSMEDSVYYSSVASEHKEDPDYDQLYHNTTNDAPIYENKGFQMDARKLNVEGINYADLVLEESTSENILNTGPVTVYSTVKTTG